MTIAETIKALIEQRVRKINTLFPAKVVKVNTYTVDVIPKYYYQWKKGGVPYTKEPPVLRDLPVVYPRGGNSIILTPIAVNDVVLVGCSQVALRHLLKDLSKGHVKKLGRFSLDDAFVLGGFIIENEWGETIYGSEVFQIPTDDLKIVSNEEIWITASKVNLGGDITLQSGARKYRDVFKGAEEISSAGSNPAVATDSVCIGGIAWRFSDGVTDEVELKFPIPSDMDITADAYIVIGWYSPSTSGNVKWQLEFLTRAEDEAINASADLTTTTIDGASSTANGLVLTSITVGQSYINSGDDLIECRISRLGSDGDDTLTDYAYLLYVKFHYLSNKWGSDS